MVKTMAEQDLAAAAAFVAGLDPGGAKNRAVTQLVQTWLGNDWLNNGGGSADAGTKITGVLQWIASLPEPDAQRQAAQQASERLYRGAPEETIAFLNSPPGASAPQQLFDHVAKHLAQKNPESAMHWAAALPPERRDAAQTAVLSEWIASRPEAVQQWVRELPAGEARTQSVSALTAQLAEQSLESTRQWLTSLPEADRPAAVAGLQASRLLSPTDRGALEALAR